MPRAMKDSGLEWVGLIPEDWKIVRIKDHYHFETGFTPDTKYAEYYEDENGYEWATISDIEHGMVNEPTKALISRRYVALTHRIQIPKGSLLYSFKLSVGQTALTNRPLFTNEAIASFLPDNRASLSFLKYSSMFIEYNGNTNIYGANILNQQLINNAYVVYPPLIEQHRIAAFLDSKCAEIDALRADIEKEIKTLEEYKKSVITETVTKGLDPNVEMKDSGISEFGSIPRNWDKKRLKYLFSSGKGLSITKEDLIEEGLPVISYGQIHAKGNDGVSLDNSLLRFVDRHYKAFYPQCEVKQYDFVFADTSEDYDGCGNCVYKRDADVTFGGYHTIVLHSTTKQDNRYLAFLFQTNAWRKQLRENTFGIKVFSITQKLLLNAFVLLPPFEEQQAIADYLDVVNEHIKHMVADKKNQLSVLENYRKTVIYEYVTGKKEVPVA